LPYADNDLARALKALLTLNCPAVKAAPRTMAAPDTRRAAGSAAVVATGRVAIGDAVAPGAVIAKSWQQIGKAELPARLRARAKVAFKRSARIEVLRTIADRREAAPEG
jgi:hypothetical protein